MKNNIKGTIKKNDCGCFEFDCDDNILYMDSICFVAVCSHCGLPVVVYAPHGEKPNGAGLVHMEKVLVEYGSKINRLGKVSKEKMHEVDHFHLHLR